MNHRNACVYDDEVGVGGTSKWKITGIDPNTTLAVYFEIVNQVSSKILILKVCLSWFVLDFKTI